MGVTEHRDEHLGLCAGLVLDALDRTEREEIERHLGDGCAICEAELTRLGEGLVLLAASAGPATPSAALRTRVFDAVRAQGPPQAVPRPATGESAGRVIPLRQPRRSSIATWGWAAAAVLL